MEAIIAGPLEFVNTFRYGADMDERLDRHAWIDAGLAKLAEEGPQSLKVMGIAQYLGVTKGSFYWHFPDLQAYKTAVLQEWERTYTQDLIMQANRLSIDARTRLCFSLKTVLAGKSPLGSAIREWALTDEDVAQAQDRVDQDRLVYVSGLLHEMGWPRDDAARLARWIYYAIIGYFNTRGHVLTEQEIDLYLARFDRVT